MIEQTDAFYEPSSVRKLLSITVLLMGKLNYESSARFLDGSNSHGGRPVYQVQISDRRRNFDAGDLNKLPGCLV